jgi:hypothetical protein
VDFSKNVAASARGGENLDDIIPYERVPVVLQLINDLCSSRKKKERKKDKKRRDSFPHDVLGCAAFQIRPWVSVFV